VNVDDREARLRDLRLGHLQRGIGRVVLQEHLVHRALHDGDAVLLNGLFGLKLA
jgi:hypothetical protein